MTQDALDKLEPANREKTVARWVKKAKPRQRMEATAAALELIGQPVTWDRQTAFDKQIPAAERAVADLDAETRARFDEQYPIALVMLHKRISLAFKIKSRISYHRICSPPLTRGHKIRVISAQIEFLGGTASEWRRAQGENLELELGTGPKPVSYDHGQKS